MSGSTVLLEDNLFFASKSYLASESSELNAV